MRKPASLTRRVLLDREDFFKKQFTPDVKAIETKVNNKKIRISRNEFFQFSPYWIKTPERELYPVVWMTTNSVLHPVRHSPERGILLYERYVYEINKTISFRVIDPACDLAVFTSWHNNARVAEYWELNGTKENHLKYIEKNLADPHLLPSILDVDGKPTGYFEFYWVKEDRLGPYYESSDFDRGFHFLIGERKFLGIENTHAVLKCIVHYLFLDDPRTYRIMAEPRSDNKKVLRYVDSFPVWKRVKEIDFPHKRALLIECTRKRLFTGKHL